MPDRVHRNMPRGKVALVLLVALHLGACQSTAGSSSQASATRAHQLCELRELESVGYQPWQEDFYYPRNLQAAQARLEAVKRARGLEGVDTCAAPEASGNSR
ncbi:MULTISPECIES: DUF4148 domain-containing protein [unclassified Caballeronia]|uniref:DUF4148 domain-containing protein n=1 Tax=unclassified Caballeronia TaxID=2646786 RepID=UPI00285EF093|nr:MULTISPECIES: DUF4148 domain-containing protein [unclassified Caballeronia]MDR5740474.1 DUF4148 domain-containing protein [Caballeronia sp. LZ016]MDR5809005.1 DUF4148 domain-containing protein [Caballeronia sp. LZ019]